MRLLKRFWAWLNAPRQNSYAGGVHIEPQPLDPHPSPFEGPPVRRHIWIPDSVGEIAVEHGNGRTVVPIYRGSTITLQLHAHVQAQVNPDQAWHQHIGPKPGTRHRRHCFDAGFAAGYIAGRTQIISDVETGRSYCDKPNIQELDR